LGIAFPSSPNGMNTDFGRAPPNRTATACATLRPGTELHIPRHGCYR
jgi:hypothetical protein